MAGGMLTIFGFLSIIAFAVYVMDDIVRKKSNIILEEKQQKIGGLEWKIINDTHDYFSGNQTC
jgi:Na+-transporting methylmalonyl-CoA/oxaloacetate decarboxylase gamma subunit